MSNAVVLVGFSTSGKSTLGIKSLNYCRAKQHDVVYRDSDEEIGSTYGGHIADIFATRSHSDAISLITAEERKFLDSIAPSEVPTLIVAGPNVALRSPEWDNFLERIEPITYYFKIDPTTCYTRLKLRHDGLKSQYGQNSPVLLVNKGVLGDVDRAAQFREYSREDAIARIAMNMQAQVQRYEAIATPERTFSATMDDQQKKTVRNAIAKDLGLPQESLNVGNS